MIMEVHSTATDKLMEAILSLKNTEECYRFFEDLCTVKELQDMAQRFDAAVLLYEGSSYQKIAQRSSISSATISRVNKSLNYGENGYRMIIDRLKRKDGDK